MVPLGHQRRYEGTCRLTIRTITWIQRDYSGEIVLKWWLFGVLLYQTLNKLYFCNLTIVTKKKARRMIDFEMTFIVT